MNVRLLRFYHVSFGASRCKLAGQHMWRGEAVSVLKGVESALGWLEQAVCMGASQSRRGQSTEVLCLTSPAASL